MEDLMKLRESIDEIDSEIVRLYKERLVMIYDQSWYYWFDRIRRSGIG